METHIYIQALLEKNSFFSSYKNIYLTSFLSLIIIGFFSVLPIGIKSKKEVFKEKIGGIDPGAPKNPKIGKKFFVTTLITTIIFIVIYYLVEIDFLNLREFLQ